MKYTRIPETSFQSLQLGAGVLLSAFDPAQGTVAEAAMLGATSGGVTFTAEPDFSDFGDDIDNCPKNMKELKRLESWEAKLKGSFVTISPALAARLLGAATAAEGTVTPRNELAAADFSDLWWVGDYSGGSGGFLAIHMKNTLSTGGFQLKSGDGAKGSCDFEFTAHYSLDAQTEVPFTLYVIEGAA